MWWGLTFNVTERTLPSADLYNTIFDKIVYKNFISINIIDINTKKDLLM